MKNRLLSLAIAGVFLASSLAFGAGVKQKTSTIQQNNQRYHELTPATGEVSLQRVSQQRNGDLEIVPFKAQQETNNSIFRSPASTLWELNHTDGVTEYYLGSGAANDTFAVVFTPAAPCSVKYVDMSWFSDGNYTAFAAKYSAAAAAISPDGEVGQIARGDFAGTPIGELLAPYTPGSVSNSGVTFGETLPAAIGDFKVGDETDFSVEPFIIGFVKGGETPQPLADGDQAPITYTWFGGPWTEGQWGRYSDAVDVAMRVWVTYPWGAPISFATSQLPNTYDQSGPFTARVNLFDDVDADGTAITGDDDISFYYTDGIDTTEVPHSDFTEYDVETSGNGWYEVEMTGLNLDVGSVVSYWVDGTDNTDLYSSSDARSFTIKTPSNPDADLLVIVDGGVDRQSVYFDVLDEAGIVYETWNPDPGVENGIDASVINWGWDNIILFGWGAGTLPATDEADPGYATFLDNGGDLFFSDQDYFYAHGLDPTGTFSPGDFAYDYFGVADYTNDPAERDSLFLGLDGVGADFAADPYSLEGGFGVWDIAGNNWADYFTADAATGIFLGSNDGNNYGVQNDLSSGGTTIFLGFMAEANVDSLGDGTIVPGDQFTTLINNVLTEFGVSSPPLITGASGPTGTVLSGPYDVSATITDADGDAISATVKFSSDEGSTWTDIGMSADGDTYTAQIPDQSTSGYYYWYIEAEAGGDVSTYPSGSEDPAMFERFVPTATTLVYFNGGSPDGYPGAYYFGKGDFSGYTTMNFAHDTWTKELTAELVAEYTSIYEITTFGPNFDNRPVITDWLANGERNYFLAGDEWLGALSNWTDMDFSAGDFEYDVLGLTHSYNDISYYYHNGAAGASPIEAVDGNVLTGELYTEHMAAGDTLLYDPTYEIESDNWLDAFEVIDEANTTVNMTSDTTMWDNTTALPIGVNREVNDDKVVFLGFDPLSINATPYTWWGFSEFSPQTKSLAWFDIDVAVEGEKTIPTEFSLSNNYPNPFNPSTTINYTLPQDANVSIAVYNMLGQKVATLVNENKVAGRYQVAWNAADHFASGVYFYQIKAGDFSKTQKMVLMK